MLVIANLLTVEAQEKQENMITNPFLQAYDTPYNVPPFDKIKNEHFKPAILEGIKRHEEEINARIQLINKSLHGLDYQVGTFIEIDRVSSPDVEIREFKQSNHKYKQQHRELKEIRLCTVDILKPNLNFSAHYYS